VDFGLAEQGSYGLWLILTAAKVGAGVRGQLGGVGRVRLHHMVFDVAVEQFYGLSSGP
jgi:hypothetical protein